MKRYGKATGLWRLLILILLINLVGCSPADLKEEAQSERVVTEDKVVFEFDKDIVMEIPNLVDIAGRVEIDYADFIYLNGKTYYSDYRTIVSNVSKVGDQIAKSNKTVSRMKWNPKSPYEYQEGDTAFMPEGTPFYEIKGLSQQKVIVIEDESRVNGYRVYHADSGIESDFTNRNLKRVTQIDLYKIEGSMPQHIQSLTKKKEIKSFLEQLEGEVQPEEFEPLDNEINYRYEFVLHMKKEPLGYTYRIRYDGAHYYWERNREVLLLNDIEKYLNTK